MKGKSFLFALILLLLSASGVAARPPAAQPIHIAATALTPAALLRRTERLLRSRAQRHQCDTATRQPSDRHRCLRASPA